MESGENDLIIILTFFRIFSDLFRNNRPAFNDTLATNDALMTEKFRKTITCNMDVIIPIRKEPTCRFTNFK